MKMRRSDNRSIGIFEFICRYTNRRGFPPTVGEIAASQGFKSNSGVILHLDKLEKWGCGFRATTANREAFASCGNVSRKNLMQIAKTFFGD